jgi:hypothetical protein
MYAVYTILNIIFPLEKIEMNVDNIQEKKELVNESTYIYKKKFYILIFIFNFIVMVIVNGTYVYATLHYSSRTLYLYVKNYNCIYY